MKPGQLRRELNPLITDVVRNWVAELSDSDKGDGLRGLRRAPHDPDALYKLLRSAGPDADGLWRKLSELDKKHPDFSLYFIRVATAICQQAKNLPKKTLGELKEIQTGLVRDVRRCGRALSRHFGELRFFSGDMLMLRDVLIDAANVELATAGNRDDGEFVKERLSELLCALDGKVGGLLNELPFNVVLDAVANRLERRADKRLPRKAHSSSQVSTYCIIELSDKVNAVTGTFQHELVARAVSIMLDDQEIWADTVRKAVKVGRNIRPNKTRNLPRRS